MGMKEKAVPASLGELKNSGYEIIPVKEEIRKNLILKLTNGEPVFPGLIGYEETVTKYLINALLAKHDIILLGHRGQGKTRLLRQLTNLLDAQIPIIAGSPVNDSPFGPISKFGRDRILEFGDKTPLEWVGREGRYGEKLATPDVSIADLIGDVDPLKAMNEKLDFSHEGVMHFGLIPRSNRGIFVINELPDLQARIQVGLLNILEERDFQIRGFPIRLPLDIFIAFSANPEDYTNRGNIITPLKDRIDSQILTHYPKDRLTALRITEQEAWIERNGSQVEIHSVLRHCLEQIAFEARADKDYVDQSSGVSSRMSISALENLISTVERRNIGGARVGGKAPWQARFMDLDGILPSLTGKMELVYEGEREGPANTAHLMITRSIKSVFQENFRDPYNRKEKNPEENPYFPLLTWFETGGNLTLRDDVSEGEYEKMLLSVPNLKEVTRTCWLKQKEMPAEKELPILMELVLEGLHAHARLSKTNITHGYVYRDVMSTIMA